MWFECFFVEVYVFVYYIGVYQFGDCGVDVYNGVVGEVQCVMGCQQIVVLNYMCNWYVGECYLYYYEDQYCGEMNMFC